MEVLDAKDDPGFNLGKELESLEQIWFEKPQTYRERG
jgi:hypothetical protein